MTLYVRGIHFITCGVKNARQYDLDGGGRRIDFEKPPRHGFEGTWDIAPNQFSICFFTTLSPQYLARSLGFSIFPVALRGTTSNMYRCGRL